MEARTHVYEEMAEFARRQAQQISAADSEGLFSALALETETTLLGETASWYQRRSFTGVA